MSPRAIAFGIAILVALLALPSSAGAANRAQAMTRVAKQVGLALKRERQSTVALRARSKEDLGKELEKGLAEALEKDANVKKVDDEANYSVQIEYRVAGKRVSLDVVLLNGRRNSVAKFSVNYDE